MGREQLMSKPLEIGFNPNPPINVAMAMFIECCTKTAFVGVGAPTKKKECTANRK